MYKLPCHSRWDPTAIPCFVHSAPSLSQLDNSCTTVLVTETRSNYRRPVSTLSPKLLKPTVISACSR